MSLACPIFRCPVGDPVAKERARTKTKEDWPHFQSVRLAFCVYESLEQASISYAKDMPKVLNFYAKQLK